MTQQRSFKKLVRARMRRTGEPYTAARAQLQRSAPPSRPVTQGGAGMYPFERFTERSKKVLTLAQEEAEAARHAYIGTEHLLLGLLRVEEGLAHQALQALGVDLGRTRDAIQAVLSGAPKHTAWQRIPTSRVKRVIEIAFEEARRGGSGYVGTDHLLLGLLIEGAGLAAKVLADMDVTLEKARAEVVRLAESGVVELTVPGQPRPGPAGAVPLAPDLRQLMAGAQAMAVYSGSEVVSLDHLLQAIDPSGLTALERMLDLRRMSAQRDQAAALQDDEAALQHQARVFEAVEALQRALAGWRAELEVSASGRSRTT